MVIRFLCLFVSVLLTVSACAEADPVRSDSDPMAYFRDQEVKWESCGADDCATIIAPIDYEDPMGDVVNIVLRRIGTGDKPALLVNPGGPGGSGVDYATYLGAVAGDDLIDNFDIIGFDPRGVVRSSPVQCLSDKDLNAFIKSDPTTDTRSALEASVADYREMGLECEKNSGPLASHVSTMEVVYDLDLIREVLGQEKLNYFGASYGTEIGALYAEVFGENVGAMVLDAPVNLDASPLEDALGQARGFQRAFDSFAAFCINQGCSFGDSIREVQATVIDFIDSLEANPLPAGNRKLSQSEGVYGIAAALYSESYWSLLDQALRDAIVRSDGSTLMQLADAYFSREGTTFLDNSFQVFSAIRCLDAREVRSIDQQIADAPKFMEASPVFGNFLAWDTACLDWPLKSTIERPKVDADRAPKILVVGTTNDPATPYEWAPLMAEQLRNGVLLTKVGDGHGAYASGSNCIDRAIERVFVAGEFPEDGTRCDP